MASPEGSKIPPPVATFDGLPDDGLHSAADHYTKEVERARTYEDRVTAFRDLIGPLIIEPGSSFPTERPSTTREMELIAERHQQEQPLEGSESHQPKLLPRRRQPRSRKDLEAAVDAHIASMNQAFDEADAALAQEPTGYLPRISDPEGLGLSPQFARELYDRTTPVGGDKDPNPTRYDLRAAVLPQVPVQPVHPR